MGLAYDSRSGQVIEKGSTERHHMPYIHGVVHGVFAIED